MSGEAIAAILGLLGILYIAWRDRNSAGDSLVGDALDLVGVLKKEMDELRVDVKELKENDVLRRAELAAMATELDWYKFGVNQLIRQLRQLGVEPAWTPESDRGLHE